jgi:diguanylate cyclase (GGDEF)-like protein
MGDQAGAARPGPGGTRRALTWLFALAVAAAGSAMLALVARMAPLEAPARLPLWGLLALAVAFEGMTVRVRTRGDAVSVTPGELVVVAGLYLASPLDLLLARLVGVLVFGLLPGHQRTGPVKLVFNGGLRLVTTGLLVVLVRVVADGVDPYGPAGWGVVVAAAVLAEVVGMAVVRAAFRVSGTPSPFRPWDRRVSLGVTLLMTNLGLLLVTVLRLEPAAVLLLAGPIGLAAAALIAYGRRRPRSDGIAVLYEAMRRLQETNQLDDLLVGLAAQLREEFKAEAAEVVLLADGPGRPATRVALVPGAERSERSTIELDPARAVWAGALEAGRAVRITGGGHGLATPTVTDGLVAPMTGTRGPVGVLAVLNRVGTASRFTADDLELLGALAGHVAISVENARLVGDLHHQARHDPLTGLPNRTVLAERIGTALARSGRLAVMFIDLDGFKAVNDRLGHASGDQLLVAASRRLRAALRPSDTLIRFAGDEFVVVSEDLPDGRSAGVVADRLLGALDRPFALDAGEARVAASIGIALGRVGGEDAERAAEELLRRADAAMYRAKQAGKGRWQLAR